ncbi:hypothetical protein EV356DRAFT_536594 [Viridothelium virens]|uniref:Uncharacterized protein n=1 Tax=Viridothelium virens TaxID=1048519 RepID=A0A6A6GXP3_VIRVR|nr:hypothetical protein EV356DRAFT_536594 [Viridothelium virens]
MPLHSRRTRQREGLLQQSVTQRQLSDTAAMISRPMPPNGYPQSLSPALESPIISPSSSPISVPKTLAPSQPTPSCSHCRSHAPNVTITRPSSLPPLTHESGVPSHLEPPVSTSIFSLTPSHPELPIDVTLPSNVQQHRKRKRGNDWWSWVSSSIRIFGRRPTSGHSYKSSFLEPRSNHLVIKHEHYHFLGSGKDVESLGEEDWRYPIRVEKADGNAQFVQAVALMDSLWGWEGVCISGDIAGKLGLPYQDYEVCTLTHPNNTSFRGFRREGCIMRWAAEPDKPRRNQEIFLPPKYLESQVTVVPNLVADVIVGGHEIKRLGLKDGFLGFLPESPVPVTSQQARMNHQDDRAELTALRARQERVQSERTQNQRAQNEGSWATSSHQPRHTSFQQQHYPGPQQPRYTNFQQQHYPGSQQQQHYPGSQQQQHDPGSQQHRQTSSQQPHYPSSQQPRHTSTQWPRHTSFQQPHHLGSQQSRYPDS